MAMGRREWPRCINPTCNMRVMKEGKTCRKCSPVARSQRVETEEQKKRRQEKRLREKRAAGTLAAFEGF